MARTDTNQTFRPCVNSRTDTNQTQKSSVKKCTHDTPPFRGVSVCFTALRVEIG